MRGTVYNSAIPNLISNFVNRALRLSSGLRLVTQLSLITTGLLLVPTVAASTPDWSGPEQQLSRKIVAVTGPGAVSLTMENRSSLSERDSEIIQNGLRSALEGLGLRFVKVEQSAATVAISLSENLTSYIWVAQVRQGAGEAAVAMVSAPRAEGSTAPHDSVPLTLRKIPLWSGSDPILDVAVLEEGATPTRIAVLGPEKVLLYRLQSGKWQEEQALSIVHARPWPRDLRGRLMLARDHLLDIFIPGVICRSNSAIPLALNCRESDDPWPLVPLAQSAGYSSVFPSAGSAGNGAAMNAATIAPMRAFFAPNRNFFTGALTPAVGKFTNVPKFYAAAPVPRDKYILWLFAATDGQIHMIDGMSDQATRLGWGSDLASVKTSCGAGWQVLATSSAQGSAGESVRAYEFPDRDPVAVSTAIDIAGVITALWTESKGDTAIAVARNRETGSYEAFQLVLSCGQ